MTNSEAINLLDNLVGMVDDNHDSDYDTALSMAIKSLEQGLCVDVISREDALLALTGEFKESVGELIPKAIKRINSLPSVNLNQRTGYWIQTEEKDDAEPFILWECSECHKKFRSVVHKVSNYCPNCGIKMVGDVNE